MHPSSLNGGESFKQGEKGKVIFQTYDDDFVIYAGMMVMMMTTLYFSYSGYTLCYV